MTTIQIYPDAGGFAENKDEAKVLRVCQLLPALERGDKVVIDFEGINYATQSFVHALIGESLQKHGEKVLDNIEFKHCSPQLQGLIELVVDYSLGGFSAVKI